MALCLVRRQGLNLWRAKMFSQPPNLALRTKTESPYPNEAHVVLNIGIGYVASERDSLTKLSTRTV